MDLYLDSADLDEIRAARDLGVLDGVTTNPSIIAKAERGLSRTHGRHLRVVKGPVSAEVTATQHDAMLEEAEPLLEIGEQIVIKLPHHRWHPSLQQFVEPRVRTNLDSCFQPLQRLMGRQSRPRS